VPTASAGAAPTKANPPAASSAKVRLRIKISQRRQPPLHRFFGAATQAAAAALRQLTFGRA
jgi:hypothetical protein